MKTRGFVYLSAFGVLILAIGLACGPVTTTTTPQVIVVTATPANAAPVSTATATATVITAPATDAASTTTSGTGQLTTFTDQNKYYAIDVPADWTYSHILAKNNHYYIDRFKSPDEMGIVENIAYNDGTVFSGTDNGAYALQLLNNYYSNTGKQGDIRVTDTGTEPDGSQRLTWTSKGGGYSGRSYFELRDRYTFLMLTVEWSDSQKAKYSDLLDNVVTSYRKP